MSQEYEITLFHRDGGPVCYEIPVELIEGDGLAAVLASLQSEFSWIIRVLPHQADTAHESPVPISGKYESLNSWQKSKILEAVRFRDKDSDGLCIELFGLQIDDKINGLEPLEISSEVKRFIKAKPSLIEIVVLRLGDSPFWYVFVTQNVSKGAGRVLEKMGVGPSALMKQRDYSGLRSMKLEEVYGREGERCTQGKLENQELTSLFKGIMKAGKITTSTSSKLCGVVFISLNSIPDMSADLAFVGSTARKNNVRIVGMLSGLLQLAIEGQPEALESSCQKFVDDVMGHIQKRGVAVWTIQPCLIGCWGDENWTNYGVLIPNLQAVLSKLASAHPGQTIKV